MSGASSNRGVRTILGQSGQTLTFPKDDTASSASSQTVTFSSSGGQRGSRALTFPKDETPKASRTGARELKFPTDVDASSSKKAPRAVYSPRPSSYQTSGLDEDDSYSYGASQEDYSSTKGGYGFSGGTKHAYGGYGGGGYGGGGYGGGGYGGGGYGDYQAGFGASAAGYGEHAGYGSDESYGGGEIGGYAGEYDDQGHAGG